MNPKIFDNDLLSTKIAAYDFYEVFCVYVTILSLL